jgi:2,3,4,5-tetrahydropyridine-2,6-dicarboxylate N-succinyltransferase
MSVDATPVEHLKAEIEAAWDRRDQLTPHGPEFADARRAVVQTLERLDKGVLRVAEKAADGQWTTHQWLKQAVLLSFRLYPDDLIGGSRGAGPWWDRVPNKFDNWSRAEFEEARFRSVPTAVVRRGAYVGRGAVLMPCFVNIGAHVGEGAMIDTWATVGSCAQIGRNVHISGGAGIGGVLEPLQANPTIIEDGAFIGARSEVAEGVIVGEGAVVSMGVFLGQSTAK